MPLDAEYQALADEVTALTDIRDAVSTAFSMQQQKISDLQDKIAAMQGPGAAPDQTEALAAVAKDIAALHELNAAFRSAIPAGTVPVSPPNTQDPPVPQPDPGNPAPEGSGPITSEGA